MAVTNNFGVEAISVGAERAIVKTVDSSNPTMVGRLEQEWAAYDLLLEHLPELVPRVFPEVLKSNEGIATEELTDLGEVDGDTMIAVIEKLQDLPNEQRLPEQDYEYYRDTNRERVKNLLGRRALRGLTGAEAIIFSRGVETNKWSINAFDRGVFVHTDIQKRHFGRGLDDDGNAVTKLFDFDQAHIGNELEDFAFLSIRHPELAPRIMAHLRGKFSDDPSKLSVLGDAMKFFQNYFILKGIYDRANQPRGNTFDTLAKVYGRAVLVAPPLQRVTGAMINLASKAR